MLAVFKHKEGDEKKYSRGEYNSCSLLVRISANTDYQYLLLGTFYLSSILKVVLSHAMIWRDSIHSTA